MAARQVTNRFVRTRREDYNSFEMQNSEALNVYVRKCLKYSSRNGQFVNKSLSIVVHFPDAAWLLDFMLVRLRRSIIYTIPTLQYSWCLCKYIANNSIDGFQQEDIQREHKWCCNNGFRIWFANSFLWIAVYARVQSSVHDEYWSPFCCLECMWALLWMSCSRLIV